MARRAHGAYPTPLPDQAGEPGDPARFRNETPAPVREVVAQGAPRTATILRTMRWFLGFVFTVVLAVAGRGQERHVQVQLEGGETVAGIVLAMDLATLRIQVGDQVRTIDATQIRHCRFEEVAPPAAPAGEMAPAAPPAAEPAAPRPAVKPAVVADDPLGEDVEAAANHAPAPGPGPGLWRSRMQRLDAAFPWLHPMAPQQWISLGLLVLILSSLAIHGSVRVAGAEAASFGRSFGLGIWYLATGAIQVATIPSNHFTAVLMLLANPTLALFWLTGLFGLTRVGASVAFAVQLGFVALAYGILELVTAILASIGMAQA